MSRILRGQVPVFTVIASAAMMMFMCTQVPVVRGQESCLAYNITRGETLKADCEAHCSPNQAEPFDFAGPNKDSSSILDRTTVCRCTNGVNTTFECSDVEPNVWDTDVELKECEVYNITSGTTCKEFCSDIDPIAFQYEGSGDSFKCYCADPPTQICGNSGALSSFRFGLSVVSLLVVTARLSSSDSFWY